MSTEHFQFLAAGIAEIRPETGRRSMEERVERAVVAVDERLQAGDVTQPERQQLRFLIGEVVRMNAHRSPAQGAQSRREDRE